MLGKLNKINGRYYDESGRIVDIAELPKNAKVFSDINNTAANKPRPQITIKQTRKSHSIAGHAKRKIEKSKTLARGFLQKPNLANEKPNIHSTSSIIINNKTERLAAMTTHKSKYIKKFANIKTSSSVSKESTETSPHISNPAQKSILVPRPETKEEVKKSYNPFDDAVERALPASASNKAYNIKPKHPIYDKSNLVALVLVLIGIIIILFNLSTIRLRFLSIRSGVSISIPKTVPSGYKLESNIIYSKGTATITFSNGTSSFKITEQNDPFTKKAAISNITSEAGNNISTYSWTKNHIDYFLYAGNLSQDSINNLYYST